MMTVRVSSIIVGMLGVVDADSSRVGADEELVTRIHILGYLLNYLSKELMVTRVIGMNSSGLPPQARFHSSSDSWSKL